MPKPLLPKGEIITCPDCGLEAMRVVKDLFLGDVLDASALESINFKSVNGALTICPECGAAFMLNGDVHTKKGWVLND